MFVGERERDRERQRERERERERERNIDVRKKYRWVASYMHPVPGPGIKPTT